MRFRNRSCVSSQAWVGRGNISGPYRNRLFHWSTKEHTAFEEVMSLLWPWFATATLWMWLGPVKRWQARDALLRFRALGRAA